MFGRVARRTAVGAALVLLGAALGSLAPATAVDCYPPGSCISGTPSYTQVPAIEIAVGTVLAQTCIGTVCTTQQVQVSSLGNLVTLKLADGTIFTFTALSGSGTPVAVNADGHLIIPLTGGVSLNLSGLRAGTYVDVYIASHRVLIGKLLVGPDGKVKGSLPLPPGIEIGAHTLQFVGTSVTGAVINVAKGVYVSSGPAKPSAARFQFGSAKPGIFGSTTMKVGKPYTMVATLLNTADGTHASTAVLAKLPKCAASVSVKTSKGKTLLANGCMMLNVKGQAMYTWNVPSTASGKAVVTFRLSEAGRQAATLSRTFSFVR